MSPTSEIRIFLNGRKLSLVRNDSIAALLAHLELAGKRVAVERNGEIVPRGLHAQTVLAEGDRIEIVVAVGGG